jgi:hypothetical protein
LGKHIHLKRNVNINRYVLRIKIIRTHVLRELIRATVEIIDSFCKQLGT